MATNTIPQTVESIASDHDAYILLDRDGDIAIQRRHYDDEGIEEIRYAPDACHYLQESAWESMTHQQAARAIC